MFESIKTFLLEHWELLLSVFLCVASIVLAAVRKKPELNKLNLYLNELLEHIPVFINLVEKKGHGTEKKLLVLEMCKEFLIENFGFYDFDSVSKYIGQYIETVLSTPQKKKED